MRREQGVVTPGYLYILLATRQSFNMLFRVRDTRGARNSPYATRL
jgi:hypothetical protein